MFIKKQVKSTELGRGNNSAAILNVKIICHYIAKKGRVAYDIDVVICIFSTLLHSYKNNVHCYCQYRQCGFRIFRAPWPGETGIYTFFPSRGS